MPKGSALIAEIINHKNTTTIGFGTGGSHEYPDDETNATKGKGSNATISIDNSKKAWVMAWQPATKKGKIYYPGHEVMEYIERHIEYGHELIHALRDMKGISIPASEIDTNMDKMSEIDQKLKPYQLQKEEFEVSGIRQYSKSVDYTEADIRAEHGLNRRTSISGGATHVQQ